MDGIMKGKSGIRRAENPAKPQEILPFKGWTKKRKEPAEETEKGQREKRRKSGGWIVKEKPAYRNQEQ